VRSVGGCGHKGLGAGQLSPSYPKHRQETSLQRNSSVETVRLFRRVIFVCAQVQEPVYQNPYRDRVKLLLRALRVDLHAQKFNSSFCVCLRRKLFSGFSVFKF
jgi:hypothetical protein